MKEVSMIFFHPEDQIIGSPAFRKLKVISMAPLGEVTPAGSVSFSGKKDRHNGKAENKLDHSVFPLKAKIMCFPI